MHKQNDQYKQKGSNSVIRGNSPFATTIKSSLPASLKVSYQHSDHQNQAGNTLNESSQMNSPLTRDLSAASSPYRKNYIVQNSRELPYSKRKLQQRTQAILKGEKLLGSYFDGQRSSDSHVFPTQINFKHNSSKETNNVHQELAKLPYMESVSEIYEKDRRQIYRLVPQDYRRTATDYKLAPIRPEVQQPTVEEFHQYYRQSDRYDQLQQFYQIDPNIYSKMNSKMQTERLMPRSMKLFESQSDKLIANDLFGSDPYVELFAQGLSSTHFQNLKVLSLRNNMLNNKRIKMLINNLPTSLLEIDLSNNLIGSEGIQGICKFIQSRNCYLQTLILEDNKLRDPQANSIFHTLTDSKTIKVLNLSRNLISDYSMENLGNLLKKSFSLQELYLHFNQIKNSGGVVLFRALAKNQYLKVLDISFNKLGSNLQTTQAIAEVLAKPHPELTHVDFSYNNFNNVDGFEFHKSLAYNQQIYGFHFEGNNLHYSINSRGFLVNVEEEEEDRIKQNMIFHRRQSQQLLDSAITPRYDLKNKMFKLDQNFKFSDPNSFKRIQSVNCTNNVTKDHCWICEGWTEMRFQYIVGKSGRIGEYPIFIHFDFDQYRPQIMYQEGNVFELYRMCPPNRKISYFFSNPLMDIQFIADDQKTTQLDELDELRVMGVPLFYADGTVMQSQRIKIVNYVHSNQNKNVIDATKHYIPTIISRPRDQEKIFDIDPSQAKNRVWSIENSIFKDFQADTEGHLLDCFDFDFECGRLQKHIPNPDDLEDLKGKIKTVYKNILACYKYYCAQTLNYELPCINQVNFVDFIQSTSILEKNQMNNIDLQLTFLSSYVVNRTSEFRNVLDRCLVRFQFLEVIIRLAKEQYLRTNICNNIADAIDKLFHQDKVLNLVQQFGISQDWRDSRYWTQLLDTTIKMKIQPLQLYYDIASKLTFKHNKYVTLTDFKMFFLEQLDLSKYISESELYLIYLQSMQTERDEINESKHMEMQFIEFIEALARVSELLSPISPMYALRNQNVNQVTRKALPLFVKFEGLICLIFSKLKPQLAQLVKSTDPKENPLQTMETEVVFKTVLKSSQAKKMGVYEEDRSSDEEREKEFNFKSMHYLPEKEENSPRKLVGTSTGWSKLRNWAQRRVKAKTDKFDSVNILKKVQTYQEEEGVQEQEEYEKANMYEKMEIQQRRIKKKEFQKTALYHEPTFKFEEQQEL